MSLFQKIGMYLGLARVYAIGRYEMFRDERGPVEHFSFGRFQIRGVVHGKNPDGTLINAGKDIRIIGDAVTPWAEGKGHDLEACKVTGISPAETETLVIGLGAWSGVQCPPPVLEAIHSLGFQRVLAVSTPEACKIFNDLSREKKPVALLAHGSC